MILSSNWTASDGFSLKDGFEVCSEVPTLLPDLLLENKSFVLVPEEEHSDLPCSLTLSSELCGSPKNVLEPVQVITSITLVSEAKLVEVFVGDYEEYFKSFSGQVIQSFPDSIVCRTDIDLLKPKKKVKLLLKSLFDTASVMVYGVFVRVEEIGSQISDCSNFSRFSSSHLNSLLADRSLNLSENALALKKLVEQYNDNVDNSSAASFGNLMPLIGMTMARARTSKEPPPEGGTALSSVMGPQNNILNNSGGEGGWEQRDNGKVKVPPVQENGKNASQEGDLDSNTSVRDNKAFNGNCSSCERVSKTPCHGVQPTRVTDAEFISNALKNQLNLNLNNSLSPASAQLVSLFLKGNESNITDYQQGIGENSLLELTSIERSLSIPSDAVLRDHDAASCGPAPTTTTSILFIAQPSAASNNNPSSTTGCRVTCSEAQTTRGLTQASACVHSCSEALRFTRGHTQTACVCNRSEAVQATQDDTQVPCVNSLPEAAAAVQSPPNVVCSSACACHHLEKIIDLKFEKFEARIERLIDRKLDECVTQILGCRLVAGDS
ncbi:Protein of unknown function DUF4506 [Trinorchestia longiramus]|nr:Protein of unknown function DUF4506 [Trinorchestia longiramus]